MLVFFIIFDALKKHEMLRVFFLFFFLAAEDKRLRESNLKALETFCLGLD